MVDFIWYNDSLIIQSRLWKCIHKRHNTRLNLAGPKSCPLLCRGKSRQCLNGNNTGSCLGIFQKRVIEPKRMFTLCLMRARDQSTDGIRSGGMHAIHSRLADSTCNTPIRLAIITDIYTSLIGQLVLHVYSDIINLTFSTKNLAVNHYIILIT